jgi:hypothetical protein
VIRKLSILPALLVLAVVGAVGAAAPETHERISLWPNGAPGSEARRKEPEEAKDYWVKNIHDPSIEVYLPPPDKATGAGVVVVPDGGHRLLVFKAEGQEPAEFLNRLGVAAFALKYRLAREEGSSYSIEGDARVDAYRSLRLVRSRAEAWHLDPKRSASWAFSRRGSSGTRRVRRRGWRRAGGRPDRSSQRTARFHHLHLSRAAGRAASDSEKRAAGVPPGGERRPVLCRADREAAADVSRRRCHRRSTCARERRTRVQHGTAIDALRRPHVAAAPGRLARGQRDSRTAAGPDFSRANRASPELKFDPAAVSYLLGGGFAGNGIDAWSATYSHFPLIFLVTAVTRTVIVCGAPPAFGVNVRVTVPHPVERSPAVW